MGDLERRLDEAQHYFEFAKQFGWTSTQVDTEPAWLVDSHAMIFDADVEARELLARQRAASNRAGRHLRG